MSSIPIVDIPIFVLPTHKTEVEIRQAEVARVTGKLAQEVAEREADIVDCEQQLRLRMKQEEVLTAETERLRRRMEDETETRRDEMARVLARVRKLQRDFQAFCNSVRPRVAALEAAEQKRIDAENEERRARADPKNWVHRGLYGYNLMLTEQNVQV